MSFKNGKKKLAALILCLTVFITTTPTSVFALASEGQEEGSNAAITMTENVEETGTVDSDEDNDELFAEYVDRAFLGTVDSGKKTLLKSSQGAKLTAINDQLVYAYLKEKATLIAAGDESVTTTAFKIALADLDPDASAEYTAEDLGLETLSEDGEKLSDDAKAALRTKLSVDLDKVIQALMADCPYELYWFDKTAGYGKSTTYSFGYYSDFSKAYLGSNSSVTIYMAVASSYTDGTTASVGGSDLYVGVDTEKTSAASVAASNAKSIVEEYASSEYSDYDKVAAYKERICDLTSYNEDAAHDSSTVYGDPWQLIWVFDGDPETTVVCEGYSKAFQYLCEMTSFRSSRVECYSVSGTMSKTGSSDSPEGHMWNILTMDDRANYLVDVTNCDTGTSGNPDLLFLKGYADQEAITASENVDGVDTDYDTTRYSFTTRSGGLDYIYNYDTEKNYKDKVLSLSAYDYDYDQGTAVWPHSIVVASDRHGNTTAIAEAMTQIAADKGEEVEYVSMIGDMVDNTNSYKTSTVLSEVTAVFDWLTNETVSILYGSHDKNATDDAGIMQCWGGSGTGRSSGTSGLIYTGYEDDGSPAYYVYGIAYGDMINESSSSSVPSQAQAEADDFMGWIDSLEDDTTPVIVLSHVPIHYKRGDNLGATFWNEALNYAATGSANGTTIRRHVVFMHGHNHTTEQVEYYYEPGDTISVQGTSKSSSVKSEIYYTYITAGYLKQMSTKNATVVSVEGDTVTFTKYHGSSTEPLGEVTPYFIDCKDIEVIQGTESAEITYAVYYYDKEVTPDAVQYQVVSDTGGIINEVSEDGVITFSGDAGEATVQLTCTADGNTLTKNITVSSVAVTGSCGNNLTWAFDIETGELRISGTGAMSTYSSSSAAPWNDFSDRITSVVIDEGVTSIGAYAFNGCSALKTVTLWKGLSTVGRSAFNGCGALSRVNYYGTSSDWGAMSITSGSGGPGGGSSSSGNSYLTNANRVYWLLVTINAENCAVTVTRDSDGSAVNDGDYVENGTVLKVECEPEEGYAMHVTPDETITVTSDSNVEITAAAHVHEYDSVVTEPTCTDKGYTTYTCSICGDTYTGDETEALGHDYEAKVTAPTCTEKGYTTYTCSRCGDSYKGDETEATGHDWGDWEVTEAATCSKEGTKTRTCKNDEKHIETAAIEKVDHTPGEAVKENEVAATCTKEGSYDEVVYCTVCNTELSREAKTIAKVDHTAGEAVKENEVAATCTKEGSYDEVVYCSVCGEELSRETKTVEAPGHTKGEAVKENEVAATCTKDGSYEEVVYCAVCGEEISRETKTVEALGHDYVAKITKPTCTEGGYTTYTCSRCDDTYKGDETEALGHDYEAKVTAPTCTECGYTTYTCSRCGDTYKGDETEALGHDWGEWEVTEAATCSKEGTKTRVCKNNKTHTETAVIEKTDHTPGEAVKENEVAATCTKDGSYEEVVYCTVCNTELSREAKTIAKIAHTEETIPAVAATCTETGLTSGVKCSVCGEILTPQTETEALGHDYEATVTDPTCTEGGYTTYTCSRCGDSYKGDETEATGHDWGNWEVTEAATCSKEGTKTRVCKNNKAHTETAAIEKTDHTPGEAVRENEVAATCTKEGSYEEVVYCTVCGEELGRETKTIAKTAHTEEIIPAVAATCTKTGLTEGVKCSVCGEILTAQEKTEALGHDWGEWTVIKEATLEAEGEESRTCKNDPTHIETRPIDKLDGDEEAAKEAAKDAAAEADAKKDSAEQASAKAEQKAAEAAAEDATDEVISNAEATAEEAYKSATAAMTSAEASYEAAVKAYGENSEEAAVAAETVAEIRVITASASSSLATVKKAAALRSLAKATDAGSAASQAAKTPGNAAVKAAEAYKTAANEAATKAQAAVEAAASSVKAAEAIRNELDENASEEEIKAAEQAVKKANAALVEAKEAQKTANSEVKKAAAAVSDAKAHTGTPVVKISANKFTYKYKVVGKKAVAIVQKPTIKSVTLNGKALKASDYTVKWSNSKSKAVGKYTVTVTLKGNYNGKKTVAYNILPKAAAIKTLTAGKRQFTATWAKRSANDIKYKAITGYQIRYSTNSKYTNGKTVNAGSLKAVKKTVTKLKAKKYYYVQIRTYKTVGGKKYCSSWSKTKKVKTK